MEGGGEVERFKKKQFLQHTKARKESCLTSTTSYTVFPLKKYCLLCQWKKFLHWPNLSVGKNSCTIQIFEPPHPPPTACPPFSYMDSIDARDPMKYMGPNNFLFLPFLFLFSCFFLVFSPSLFCFVLQTLFYRLCFVFLLKRINQQQLEYL